MGQAVQIKRALKVLEKYAGDDWSDFEKVSTEIFAELNRSEADALEAIKEFRPAGTVNRERQEALSDNVKLGLTNGRSTVLAKIQEARDSPYQKDYLRRMKAYYETLLNRL